MEKTKLISVRMSPATLEKVENLTIVSHYWKKSTVINNIVQAIVDNADEKDIMKLVRYWPHGSEKLKISVEASSM